MCTHLSVWAEQPLLPSPSVEGSVKAQFSPLSSFYSSWTPSSSSSRIDHVVQVFAVGAFSHADDIRTLSTNISDCKLQINLVSEFATSQGLTLNVDKYEASISPSIPADMIHIDAGDLQFPLTSSARCLGALWSPSLSCSRWIESNIEKARRAFFARGSGVFHGTLNPLSSKSIVEHCVLPSVQG